MSMNLTLGSLFDGIAGFPLSASRYGITTKWASEIESFPIKVTEKNFPTMKHLGDVTQINGADIEPVDIISFGSPCQDMSVAGKRAGLEGSRSGLFMEAVRIIKEMREATNGKYPRFAIWENVPGAFSSNGGNDFRAVLEEITETEIPMPSSGKWAEAGMVRGNERSVAWRVLDAQHWGVPQRRKRIFLVADFRGQCAGEVLFEREGLLGDIAESREAWEEVAACAGDGTRATSRINCEPGGISGTVSSKWAKGTGGPAGDEHYNLVALPQLYDMTNAEEVMRPVEPGLSPTLNARMGTGGNQVPVLMQPIKEILPFNTTQITSPQNGNNPKYGDPCHTLAATDHAPAIVERMMQPIAFSFDSLASNSMKSSNPNSGCREVDRAKCVDTTNPCPSKNQGGIAILEPIAHAVDVRNLCETEDLSGTLQSENSGGYSLNYQNPVRIGYRVRRLTPKECLRLQGFPDNWLDIEGASDSAKYKAVGNSVAIPCVEFVFSRIDKEEAAIV